MKKTHTVETIYEYDAEGKLRKKIVTETNEEDDIPTVTRSSWETNPCLTNNPFQSDSTNRGILDCPNITCTTTAHN